VQVAVDTEHHLIVTHEVINIGNDRGQLARMSKPVTSRLVQIRVIWFVSSQQGVLRRSSLVRVKPCAHHRAGAGLVHILERELLHPPARILLPFKTQIANRHLTLLNIIDKLATIFPTKPILVEDRPRIAPGCTRFGRLLGIRKGFNRAKDEHPLTAVQRRRTHRAVAKTYASLVEARLKMLKKLVGRRLQIKRLAHRTCVLLLSKKSKLLGRLGCNLDPGPRWISE
jgi:hypothetical protein